MLSFYRYRRVANTWFVYMSVVIPSLLDFVVSNRTCAYVCFGNCLNREWKQFTYMTWLYLNNGKPMFVLKCKLTLRVQFSTSQRWRWFLSKYAAIYTFWKCPRIYTRLVCCLLLNGVVYFVIQITTHLKTNESYTWTIFFSRFHRSGHLWHS